MPPAMAQALPAELRAVFDRFITTEYVTIDERGQPIAWPVTPYPHDDGGCVDITTGLGYPKKARDAQRNPKVAMLFSEPLGSGLDDPPMVLLQGTARVDEDDLAANRERYRREGAAKLPKATEKLPPPALDRFMSWYVDRIYVHLRPERVVVWPGGDIAAEPQVSGTLPAGTPAAAGAAPPAAQASWDPRMEQLGSQYPTAVLAIAGADGFPFAARVPVTADRPAGLIRIDAVPSAMALVPGRACLTAHAHGPQFEWQSNFQVRGDLARDGDGWALRASRLVGGFELPQGQAAMLRENFRKVRRYRKIAKREQARRSAA
jgi:Pyridoxamine 5'-phosphate oxidase